MKVGYSVKKALITGISGQDGAYLAKLLLEKGYQVYGTARDAQVAPFKNLKHLGILGQLSLLSMAPNDFRSVLNVFTQAEPDEVYSLAGQSSVGLSFEQPVETLESISYGTLNLLEVIRFTQRPIRFYNAGSSECFGDTGGLTADESTPFHPRSPYAVAKAAAHWTVANYREAYNLFACTGILFNHESSLRPSRFVTRKIIATACRIARGSKERLHLGNISIARDWGWAPEYVNAMWRILQQDNPDDYVIATGQTNTLEQFIDVTFQALNLDWHEHVSTDPSLLRPSEIMISRANPAKSHCRLGWQAEFQMRDVIKSMIAAEQDMSYQ